MGRSTELFDTYESPFSLKKLFETDAKKILRLERENHTLVEELALERIMRKNAEDEAIRLKNRIVELECTPKRKRRTKAQMEAEEKEYTEYKSDGKRKSRPADPIRSYEDFASMQGYFWENGKIRDWALWTIGVSLGLRISDLLSLKINSLLNDDKTFRDRIVIIEQKTNKANNCLITESVVDAVTKYLDSIEWKFKMDDFLFKSHKTKGKMFEEYGWKILSDAGKALNLPIVIGSHTMRKSFANIAACVDKSSIDMNAITKIQGLLNHSDQRVTMRYLGSYQQMFDKARRSVSDFVLGKTDVHEIVAGNNFTIDDIISKLNELEKKLN
ncbi:MAG: tyrosine-type recombinase/integrase [Christensenellaceae bacterium]